MRLKYTINNILLGSLYNVFTNILNFVLRTVFILELGKVCLGLMGLFTNILSFLSIAELGLTSAISFSLYKPIAENDNSKINQLMCFYKKAYRIIGCLVALIGIVIMFFLPGIIKDADSIRFLYIIYLLYLANTVSGYFLSYRITLLSADQKGYRIVPYNVVITLISTILLIITLYYTRNFIFYLVVQFILGLMQKMLIHNRIRSWYKDINFSEKGKIGSDDLSVITKNIKAMLFHKVGEFCIYSTDNIVISKFLGIAIVGIYSNYAMVISAIMSFVVIIFNSATASFGNLLATESYEKRHKYFKTFDFMGFWIYGSVSICLYNLLTPFISIWLGDSFTISQVVLIPVIINCYLSGVRLPLNIVKGSGGIYNQDKYIPILQSAVNIVFSVIFVQKYGLVGVFWGTVASCIVPLVYRPYVVYKYIFNMKCKTYYFRYFKNIFSISVAFISTTLACGTVHTSKIVLDFSVKAILCFIIPNTLILLMNYRSPEFKHFIEVVHTVVPRTGKVLSKPA